MGTALITGASSGIGEEFARQLAAQGENLILVARRKERLESLAAEFRTKGITVDVITADLSEMAEVDKLADLIRQRKDLTLLVNNAGFNAIGFFIKVPMEKHLSMIHLHVEATVRLCYAALEGMKERRSGAIINVASFGGYVPMPTSATYNATKAYLVSFSESLAYEVAYYGIRVQALCPGFVKTEIFEAANAKENEAAIPDVLWLDVKKVVAESLAGIPKKRVIVITGWVYQLARALLNLPLVNHLFKLYMLRFR